MEQASTFEDWVEYAKTLDYLEGKDQWKMVDQSRLYDYERIAARYRNLKRLRKAKDVKALCLCLRQDLVKNLGGIASHELYD
jgi:hypothetical protein